MLGEVGVRGIRLRVELVLRLLLVVLGVGGNELVVFLLCRFRPLSRINNVRRRLLLNNNDLHHL